MSIRQGKKLIASSTTNGFNLFDCKWADHILNNISWLRADTFSWQSGDVYVAAEERLGAEMPEVLYAWKGEGIPAVNEGIPVGVVYSTTETVSVGDTVYLNTTKTVSTTVAAVSSGSITSLNAVSGYDFAHSSYPRNASADYSSTEPQSETIGGTTIQFYLADDGHKICPASEESNVSAIYNSTGVAWYYILDTTNRQFKLPRTKWGFTGIRSGVGGYVAPGLPNITGSFSTASDKNLGTGAFSWTTNKYATNGGGQGGQWGINFSAKKSNSIYGNSTTVQPPATQMYLYFYVGNFEQSAIEQTAGLNAEMFNDLNAHKVIEFQTPTSANNYTWYRKYADGWVEQGGRCTVPATNSNTSSSVTVTLPVPIAAPEQATLAYNGMDSTRYYANCEDMASVTTTTVSIGRWNNGNQVAVARYYNWSLSGMSA